MSATQVADFADTTPVVPQTFVEDYAKLKREIARLRCTMEHYALVYPNSWLSDRVKIDLRLSHQATHGL